MVRGRKKSTKSSMGDFLREQIIGTEQVTDIEIAKRDIHVMTRLSEDIVEILDALVDLNVFKSRSEAVASYVESSIVSKQELYLKVLEQFKEVEDKRGKAMETVLDAFEKLGE